MIYYSNQEEGEIHTKLIKVATYSQVVVYRIFSRLGRSRRYAAFDFFKEILKNRIITPLSTLRRANLHGK